MVHKKQIWKKGTNKKIKFLFLFISGFSSLMITTAILTNRFESFS